MNKYFFTAIIFVTAISQNHLQSDQDNGKPWSEDFMMEQLHEGVEGLYHVFNGNEECGFLCESVFNELHETHYEAEESSETTEWWRESEVWWESGSTYPFGH